MKFKEFTYQKEEYDKDYKLYVLQENDTHIKGMSLNDMPEEVLQEFETLQNYYEGQMKKYFKFFKNFKKEKIIKFKEIDKE